jgi:hypothetical protein
MGRGDSDTRHGESRLKMIVTFKHQELSILRNIQDIIAVEKKHEVDSMKNQFIFRGFNVYCR